MADLPIGEYSLRVEFPAQGWYSETQVIIPLTIVPEKLIIGAMDLNIQNGTISPTTITVTDNDGNPVDGIQLYLQVNYNGAWLTIAEGYVTNGTVTLTINSSLPFGTFPLRYLIPSSEPYSQAMVEKVITISKATDLVLLHPEDLTIVYSDGISLIFLLKLNDTKDPLANETIILSAYEDGNLLFQYFGTTNSSGMVLFENVLTDLIPGHDYVIVTEFQGTESLAPSSVIVSYPVIVRDNVRVLHLPDLSTDYGPTANQTIAVAVVDETSNISVGSIYWAVYFRNSAGVWLPLDGYSGFIQLEDQSPVFFVFNLTGEYQLHVEYVNDNPYYVSREGVVIPFGWTTEEAVVVTTSFSTPFPINGSISIETRVENVGGYPLSNIMVELWTPFGNYSSTTNASGYVRFVIDPIQAGTFPLIFHIPQQGAISELNTEGLLEIRLLNIGFQATIEDTYWDEFIQIHLNDSLSNSSTYNLVVYLDGEVILQRSNLTAIELIQPFQLPISTLGQIEYNITRYNLYTAPTDSIGTFELLAVPVEIVISHSVTNNTLFVRVGIRDSRTLENLEIPYSLTVSNGSETVTLEMTKFEFEFPVNGNLTIIINVSGYYEGSASQTIFSSFSDTVALEPQTHSLLDSFSMDFFAVVFLITSGSGIAIVQKRRVS